jgi:hypothetical protein
MVSLGQLKLSAHNKDVGARRKRRKKKNWAKSPKAPSPGPVGLIRFGHQQGPSPIAVIPKLHRKYGESDKILRRN